MTFPSFNRPSARFRGWRRALSLSVLALGLTACTTYQNVVDKFNDPIVLKCPDYWVVADAANVIKYKDGPGRDLIDIDFEGKITGVQLGCLSNIDRNTKSGILEIDVTLRMDASRGPANRNRKARFDYFISVVDKNRKILFREDFPLGINFPGNKTRILFRSNPVTLEVPISPKWSSSYYGIFAGLKLTREELQFNRDKIQNSRARPSR